jgi:hypothetical protein
MLLVIIRIFKKYRAEFKGLANSTQVYSNYKIFEYFIIIKTLFIKQAC